MVTIRNRIPGNVLDSSVIRGREIAKEVMGEKYLVEECIAYPGLHSVRVTSLAERDSFRKGFKVYFGLINAIDLYWSEHLDLARQLANRYEQARLCDCDDWTIFTDQE